MCSIQLNQTHYQTLVQFGMLLKIVISVAQFMEVYLSLKVLLSFFFSQPAIKLRLLAAIFESRLEAIMLEINILG